MNGNLATKAFLYAVSMAMLDLEDSNRQVSEKFISDLRFHFQHVLNLIPEARADDRAAAEEMYEALWTTNRQLKSAILGMSPEEFSEGIQRREMWQQLYRLLDPPNEQ
jgi:hypothetical protein